MVHDPLSPGDALRTRLGASLVAFSLLTFVYALVILGQVVLGLWSLVLLAGAYLAYRSLAVLDSVADAAQRLAAVREREAGIDDRDPRGDETPRSGTAHSADETRARDREWGA